METASQKERKLINFWAKRKKNIVALRVSVIVMAAVLDW